MIPKIKKNQAILDNFEQKTWLFIHSSPIVRSSIKKTITQLGSKTSNFSDASNIEDAKKIIETKKPHYVFANKTIQDVSTISLFNVHMKVMPNRIQGGFFVITEEASQSEIAWALEYEMDGIVTVPLNGTSMLNTFLKGVQRKVPPTPYQLKTERHLKVVPSWGRSIMTKD